LPGNKEAGDAEVLSPASMNDGNIKPDSKPICCDGLAWYTAEDPNDDLLVVAKDESKQVLIFKVAVALGFDAPRAFTLVSMRGSKDSDFGVQVIGRIMRVHPLLQPRAVDKALPELLRFGYVFLADSDNQQGLSSAGEKINSIKTEMSGICPYTMVVRIAGQNQIQIVQDGQPSILPVTYTPPVWMTPDNSSGSTAKQIFFSGSFLVDSVLETNINRRVPLSSLFNSKIA
jgi:hypothetical protein